MAGAARVDITPWAGVQLAGAVGLYRPAKLVWDPLYATALVLESDSRKLCFVVLDLTIITAEYSEKIRQAAVQEFNFDPQAVIIHVTQTHSAPSAGHFMVDPDFTGIPEDEEWIRGGNAEYADFAVDRAIEAIRIADQSRQPVQIAAASGIEGRLAFNRRAITRDGTVRMPPAWQGPLGPTWLRYIEGPMDPEVGVMCVRNEHLEMVAMLLHYTCHPVHVFPRPIVSADWPGAWADALRSSHGEGVVPLVLNGCCGNINPWPPFEPDYVRDHRPMGRVLAETTRKVEETLEFTDQAQLDWRSRHLMIPLRQVAPDKLAWAEEILQSSPEPVWANESKTQVDSDWMTAASIKSVELMRQRNSCLDYYLQVFRIGQTAIVALPGEPFVECGLKIKIGSPTYPTYVAHCTSEYVGYIPTQQAVATSGHEVDTKYWSKLVPEAMDTIAETAIEMLQELFPPE